MGSELESQASTAVTPETTPQDQDEKKMAASQDGGQAKPRLVNPPLTGSKAILLAMCMCGTTFITAMTGNGILVAMPSIGRELDITDTNLQWIQSSYALAFGCFLLLSGRLADLYGRKLVYLIGVANFVVWNVACGAMKSEIGLDICRALSGIGASMASPSAVGIIAVSFPNPRHRSIVFACFGACNPIGACVGMVYGGLLSQYVSWRPVFYIIAGVSVLPFVGTWFLVPWTKEDVPNRKVDWLGAALVTSGLVLILFVLSDGINAPDGWRTSYIIALLIVGFFLVGVFLGWQYYLEHKSTSSVPPLMKLSLFARGQGKLAAIYIVVFLIFGSFMGFWLITDLYYQNYQGLSPITTVVHYLPTVVSGISFNVFVGFLAGKVSGQLIICLGVIGTGMAPLLFAIIDPHAIYWRFEFPAMLLVVSGIDCVMALGMIFTSKLVESHEQSIAAGIFLTCNQLGSALGLSLVTITYSFVEISAAQKLGSYVPATDPSFPPEAFLTGLRAAFWLEAGMSFLAFFPAAIMLRGMGTAEDKKVKKRDEETGSEATDKSLEAKQLEMDAYAQGTVVGPASACTGDLLRVLTAQGEDEKV